MSEQEHQSERPLDRDRPSWHAATCQQRHGCFGKPRMPATPSGRTQGPVAQATQNTSQDCVQHRTHLLIWRRPRPRNSRLHPSLPTMLHPALSAHTLPTCPQETDAGGLCQCHIWHGKDQICSCQARSLSSSHESQDYLARQERAGRLHSRTPGSLLGLGSLGIGGARTTRA